jgi:hypothetical protein
MPSKSKPPPATAKAESRRAALLALVTSAIARRSMTPIANPAHRRVMAKAG